jgi:hypothetical protein
MDPHFKDGFLIYMHDSDWEICVPVKHILKIHFNKKTNETELVYIDGAHKMLKTTNDEFYIKAKKEMYTELHPELNFIKKLN